MTSRAPAKTPCSSCPYRQDAPSGLWDASEYDKLPLFDVPDATVAVFHCHKADGRLCAGWCGTHDLRSLIGFRLHIAAGNIPLDVAEAAINYEPPVPLFSSGAEAAEHGKRDLDDPSLETRIVADRMRRSAQRRGQEVR